MEPAEYPPCLRFGKDYIERLRQALAKARFAGNLMDRLRQTLQTLHDDDRDFCSKVRVQVCECPAGRAEHRGGRRIRKCRARPRCIPLRLWWIAGWQLKFLMDPDNSDCEQFIIDSTANTNMYGMELFTLAVVYRRTMTAVPVAHFVGRMTTEEIAAFMCWVADVLAKRGITWRPRIITGDKAKAHLAAVRKLSRYLGVEIQYRLCHWHMFKAIEAWLRKNRVHAAWRTGLVDRMRDCATACTARDFNRRYGQVEAELRDFALDPHAGCPGDKVRQYIRSWFEPDPGDADFTKSWPRYLAPQLWRDVVYHMTSNGVENFHSIIKGHRIFGNVSFISHQPLHTLVDGMVRQGYTVLQLSHDLRTSRPSPALLNHFSQLSTIALSMESCVDLSPGELPFRQTGRAAVRCGDGEDDVCTVQFSKDHYPSCTCPGDRSAALCIHIMAVMLFCGMEFRELAEVFKVAPPSAHNRFDTFTSTPREFAHPLPERTQRPPPSLQHTGNAAELPDRYIVVLELPDGSIDLPGLELLEGEGEHAGEQSESSSESSDEGAGGVEDLHVVHDDDDNDSEPALTSRAAQVIDAIKRYQDEVTELRASGRTVELEEELRGLELVVRQLNDTARALRFEGQRIPPSQSQYEKLRRRRRAATTPRPARRISAGDPPAGARRELRFVKGPGKPAKPTRAQQREVDAEQRAELHRRKASIAPGAQVRAELAAPNPPVAGRCGGRKRRHAGAGQGPRGSKRQREGGIQPADAPDAGELCDGEYELQGDESGEYELQDTQHELQDNESGEYELQDDESGEYELQDGDLNAGDVLVSGSGEDAHHERDAGSAELLGRGHRNRKLTFKAQLKEAR